MGRRKRPFYRIIAIDSRKKRDGRYIESIGYYDPMPNPSVIELKEELALKWLRVGATTSPAVRTLLKQSGVLLKFALERADADDDRKAAIIAEWEETNQKRLTKIQDEAAAKQAKLEKAAEAASKKGRKSKKPVEEPVEAVETKPEPEAKTEETSEEAETKEPAAEPEKTAEAEEKADSSKEAAE